MKWSVNDMYHYGQHFYSTIVSNTDNCSGSDKLNCTARQSGCAVGQWQQCAAVFTTL